MRLRVPRVRARVEWETEVEADADVNDQHYRCQYSVFESFEENAA